MNVKVGDNFDILNKNHKDFNGIILEGGSRCFVSDQLVTTNKGDLPIKDIKRGDKVKSYNLKTKEITYKRVVSVYVNEPEKEIIKINLKNGKTIEGTFDHKIYFKGGWISLKHLVSLLDGNMEKHT